MGLNRRTGELRGPPLGSLERSGRVWSSYSLSCKWSLKWGNFMPHLRSHLQRQDIILWPTYGETLLRTPYIWAPNLAVFLPLVAAPFTLTPLSRAGSIAEFLPSRGAKVRQLQTLDREPVGILMAVSLRSLYFLVSMSSNKLND